MRSFVASCAVATALLANVAVAVNPVAIEGRDFVDSVTKKRFTIVGVDYQPGGQAGYKPEAGSDALTDKDTCLRDAIMIQKLGANTIRVYNVDPSLNHDDCASIFNAAGIYMILDVNSPQQSINRAEPWTSYHKDYITRVVGVIDNFMAYPNTLAFFSANEVMNDMDTGKVNPQYIRAVQRDMKAYIKAHADRAIPVGYSAADVREILPDTSAYMQCNNDDDGSSSDFFGLNSYSWCGGDASFESAGYDTLVDMFQNSSVPVFFSEYGCNAVTPRVFDETAAIYSEKMSSLSGGLVYEYSQEDNNYGLVEIQTDGTVKLLSDYDSLKKQYSKIDMDKLSATSDAATSITAPKCDKSLITNDAFDSNFTLPAVCPGCDDIIKSGVTGLYSGKIVKVAETKSSKKVYESSGSEVKDCTLKVVSNEGGSSSDANEGSSSANSTVSTTSPEATTSLEGTASLEATPSPEATTGVEAVTSQEAVASTTVALNGTMATSIAEAKSSSHVHNVQCGCKSHANGTTSAVATTVPVTSAAAETTLDVATSAAQTGSLTTASLPVDESQETASTTEPITGVNAASKLVGGWTLLGAAIFAMLTVL